jgi:hypothetical protein
VLSGVNIGEQTLIWMIFAARGKEKIMVKYIDTEKFRENLELDSYGRTNIVAIARAMEKAEVTVVEIVHCKDCKHWNNRGCGEGCGWCEAWEGGRFHDNYCSCGERKADD